MTTYYQDADVLITSTGVRMDGRDYRLGDLTQVWHRRGRRSWRTIARRGGRPPAPAPPAGGGAPRPP
ncbi:DUF6232 family protein, partial [Actinoplanes sp. NPDC026623]|uniref:DUF6232 family protein n=1 Tax=Actinoplanes sp. NPDC026623 TaxID=3155610 RepID=UPI0033E7736C